MCIRVGAPGSQFQKPVDIKPLLSQAVQDSFKGTHSLKDDSKLLTAINSLPISDSDKSKLKELVKEVKNDSNSGFFKLASVGSGELKKIQAIANSNPLAKDLLSIIAPNLNIRGIKSHDSQPNKLSFGERISNDLNALKNKFYVSQGNGLKSHSADCGPSCATMVLKRFGVFPSDTTGAAGTSKIRGLLGQSDHAIDENQIKKAVEKFSGGAVKETDRKNFSSSSSIANYAREQLAKGQMPMLLTGSPYHDDEPNYNGRHYMIITGVDPNTGNLQLADPGGKYSEMSQQRLAELMKKTDLGTVVSSFNKVN